MAGSINKVILIGNLGANPEIRVLESGQKVAQISLATNRTYKNRDGQKVDETEWHRVEYWGRLAETCEKYLQKGSTIYVEGRIRTRKWTDQNGNDRYTTEIVGENMTMLGSRSDRQGQASSQQNTPLQSTPPTSNEAPKEAVGQAQDNDDLPF